MIFYSSSKRGFYIAGINPEMPPDAVEISEQDYRNLLEAQAMGAVIEANANGYPTAAEPTSPMPPVLTAEQLVEQIRGAVQAHVDATARTRLYDGGNSLASYVASTNPAWAAEAQAFVAWRDTVWAQVYGLWAAPPDPWPTSEAVITDLPAISWPA